jgi:hypothetical protein
VQYRQPGIAEMLGKMPCLVCVSFVVAQGLTEKHPG